VSKIGLIVKLARKYPQGRLIGMDYWGKNWEYSKGKCEANVKAEGVDGQTEFQNGSAAQLPFEAEQFDAIVSNLVFHEVRDESDKSMLLKEALRVLKKGGSFALQDLFLGKKMYGDPCQLCERIKSWGIEEVELIRTNESDFIPGLLKLPFMVGTLALICGKK
jgi:ubiquinone/menaquinone biosynthesis C-methylase UbiE